MEKRDIETIVLLSLLAFVPIAGIIYGVFIILVDIIGIILSIIFSKFTLIVILAVLTMIIIKSNTKYDFD